jgi:hypothetical protein
MLNFEIKSGLDCPYLSEKRKEPFVFDQGAFDSPFDSAQGDGNIARVMKSLWLKVGF